MNPATKPEARPLGWPDLLAAAFLIGLACAGPPVWCVLAVVLSPFALLAFMAGLASGG